jgi:hypothetical protein
VEIPPYRAGLINQINNPQAKFALERNTKRVFNQGRDIAPARVNPMIRVGQWTEKGHRALPIFLRKRTSINLFQVFSLFWHRPEDTREFR